MKPAFTRRLGATLLLASSALTAGPIGAPPATAFDTEPNSLRRFALVAGVNNGGPGRVLLRYAHSDAEAFARLLKELGGVASRDVLILLEPDPGSLAEGFSRIKDLLEAAKREGVRTELLFYYSGHSDENGLLVGGTRLSYRDIREAINAVPADVRIAILDSCASGAFTRAKGGKWKAPFLVDNSAQVRGHAFLTSASADETAQESDRVGGSFFTHFLISGLRGGADDSRDGRVTLNEAYHYAFQETLAQTESTRPGPQHPNYDIQLAGKGELVITDLRGTSALLLLPPEMEGRLFIRDGEGRLVAEINKPGGRLINLGLEPGTYRVTLEKQGRLFRGEVTIAELAETVLDLAALGEMEAEPALARGGGDPSRPEDGQYEKAVVLRPVSFSFVPGLSTNYGASIQYRVKNYFSLNLFGDWSDLLAGAELSGIGAVRSSNVSGAQIAGTFNFTGGNLTGLQLSGAVDITFGRFTGFQGSGVINYSGSLTGLKTAGVVAITRGQLEGVQLAPVMGYSGSLKGLQAGTVNIAPGNVQGLQLGILNYGGTVRGAQIGVINISREIHGATIGLINFAGNGMFAPTIWGSDISIINAGIKMGSPHVYGILGAGIQPLGHDPYLTQIVGLGASLDYSRLEWAFDLLHHSLYAEYDYQDRPDFISQFRVTVGYRLPGDFSVSAGPTLNFLYSEIRNDSGLGWDFWSWSDETLRMELSPGVFLGLQYEPKWGRLNSRADG